MANYHHTFHKLGESKCYKGKLDPSDNETKSLKEAKKKVRQRLLTGLRQETERVFGLGKGVSPRFFTQGSWAYDTCNSPCHPHQEMDIDLGVYLPVENWEETEKTPKQAAKTFFNMVENILKPLAEEEGWDFSTKRTCVRLHMKNGINAHIDVPLYVAPREEFEKIKEVFDRGLVIAKAYDEEMSEQEWKDINQVVLALKNGEWLASDPRDVADYFEKKFKQEGGHQLRRICRYLKGTRDYYWKDGGGPSSVLLMICASKLCIPSDRRDDLALLSVLDGLGDMLTKPVYEPSICDENFNRMSPEDQTKSCTWVGVMKHTLWKATETEDPDLVQKHLSELRTYLDHRVPEDPALVSVAVTASTIRQTPSRQQAQPHITHVEAG